MTRERAAELAPVMKAYGEGKQIQVFCDITGIWEDYDYPSFDCLTKYRIKPEPRTWWCVLYGDNSAKFFDNKLEAEERMNSSNFHKTLIRVQEIL